jgi:hypothetical protein
MFAHLKTQVVNSWEDATDFTDVLGSKGLSYKIFPNDSQFTVVWSELEASEHSFAFSLLDLEVDDEIVGTVDAKSNAGISMHFAGYGDCTSNDNSGRPVYIDNHDGMLTVRIYGDINSKCPTHSISLEGARLENRVAEKVYGHKNQEES